MKEVAYDAAAIPEPFTILGLRLRPFCAGHLLLLHGTNSAFVSGGAPSISGLVMAVGLCAQTFEEGLASLSDPERPRLLGRWQRKLAGTGVLTRLGIRKPRIINYAEKWELFEGYLNSGRHVPYYVFDDSKTAAMDCPLLHAVWASFTRIGMPDSVFLNRSWWLSVQQYFIWKAMDGAIVLRDREEHEKELADARDVGNRLDALVQSGKLRVN